MTASDRSPAPDAPEADGLSGYVVAIKVIQAMRDAGAPWHLSAEARVGWDLALMDAQADIRDALAGAAQKGAGS